MIDEDATHRLCGDPEEMRAVLPLDPTLIDETQVGFVDERRDLQGVCAILATHRPRGLPVQLVVNTTQQTLADLFVPIPPREEQLGDVALGLGCHME
jgi:hypothetical protein